MSPGICRTHNYLFGGWNLSDGFLEVRVLRHAFPPLCHHSGGETPLHTAEIMVVPASPGNKVERLVIKHEPVLAGKLKMALLLLAF